MVTSQTQSQHFLAAIRDRCSIKEFIELHFDKHKHALAAWQHQMSKYILNGTFSLSEVSIIDGNSEGKFDTWIAADYKHSGS